LGRVLPLRKRVVIGVEIGADAIRLAKISRDADTRHTLSKYAHVPLPHDVPLQSNTLAGFLRSALDAFCAGEPQVEIWSAISSAQVETRYLQVPKVARRQLAKAVYWTFRRGASFDEAGTLFGFDILGEKSDSGARKYEVMAYTAPVAEVRAIQDLFQTAGHPLTGVTIVPFSLQNILQAGCLGPSDQSVCTLFIGREFSRIDIFEGDHMVLSRMIKAGARSMLDTLKEDLTERGGCDPTDLEQWVAVERLADLQRHDETFLQWLAQRLGMPEDDIQRMVLPAMERLIGQVERTLKHYALHFDNRQVGQLYIFGEVSILPRMADRMAEQVGIRSQVVDLFSGSKLAAEVPAPRLQTERSHLIPAMALALSSSGRTPNFLFTHEDKARLGRIDLANRALVIGWAAALLIMAGVAFIQNQRINTAAAHLLALRQRIEGQGPPLDRNALDQMVRQAQSRASESKLAAAKYLPLAILSEMAALTPAEIRLTQVEADLAEHPRDKKKDTAKGALKLKGVISGDQLSMDVILAGYILNLNASPLFSQAVVKERSLATHGMGPALWFTIHLDLEQSS